MHWIELLETRIAPATFAVTTAADSGDGSLRQAILNADVNPGWDQIVFQFVPGSVTTITPLSPLPTITEYLTIDATSLLRAGGLPGVEIDGSQVAGSGLVFASSISGNIEALAIHSFSGNDLELRGAVLVKQCYIGLHADGSVGTVHGNAGIAVYPSGEKPFYWNGPTIGSDGAGNRIGGPLDHGIYVENTGLLWITGNIIGLDGNNAPSGMGEGITFKRGSDATVRGNVIAATLNDGISVTDGSRYVIIQGNSIGVVPGSMTSGQQASVLGNGGAGIYVADSADITIAGDPSRRGNVIGGSVDAGIVLERVTRAQCYNNFVGVDEAGAAAPNGQGGIRASAIIDASFTGNRIVGNVGAGIRVDGATSVIGTWLEIGKNVISDNRVGSAGGAGGAPGIWLSNVSSAYVGSSYMSEWANIIERNEGAGIVVVGETFAGLSGNRFSGNAGLAIDLGNDGITPNDNDARDSDVGPNVLQNYPEILSARSTPDGNVVLDVVLYGPPGHNYILQFFRADSSGQPLYAVAENGTTTDANGVAHFTRTISGVEPGVGIVAIATGGVYPSSSEFSPSAMVLPSVTVVSSSFSVLEGDEVGADVSYKVQLSTAALNNFDISYQLVAKAEDGSVKLLADAAIHFNAGDAEQVITVPIPGNRIVESNRTLQFVLAAPPEHTVYLSNTPTPEVALIDNDTSLIISKDYRTATWVDADGDLVVLKVSKPVLDPSDFTFVNTGIHGGQSLTHLNLAGKSVKGAPLDVTVKSTPHRIDAGMVGDGKTALGVISAPGVKLGHVSLDGTLGGLSAESVGQFRAVGLGMTPSLTPASSEFTEFNVNGRIGSISVIGGADDVRITALSAGSISIGNFHESAISIIGRLDHFTAGQVSGGAIENGGSIAAASIGSVKIYGNFAGGHAEGTGVIRAGNIGTIAIGGDFGGDVADHSGIFSDGNVGSVTIKGALYGSNPEAPVVLCAAGLDHAGAALASLRVGGRVENAQLLAGSVSHAGESIGNIQVGGDWIASVAAASIDPGTDGLYGTNDDRLGGTSAADPVTRAIARIASVTVGGTVNGTSVESDSFGFFAQAAFLVKAAGVRLSPGLVAGTADTHIAVITAAQA